MKRVYLIIALLGIFMFAIKPSFGQHFTPVYTGFPYQPMTFVISAANLNGSGLVAGDEIAVFDLDGASNEICVGSVVLTGPIGGTPVVFSAATDDPLTVPIDGFTAGNTIIFRYWDNSAGVEVVCLTPTYASVPPLNNVYTSLGTASVSLAGITSPTAAAGANADVCETDSYTLSGAATNQASVLWTTSGTGTFDDDAILGATYTPSAADITAGSVALTLTAYAIAPCTDDATDVMTLFIQSAATADAGADATICETDSYTLSGSATNQSAVLWTTSGTGTFDDDAILGAEYTPSAADITAGSVVLTLTATATAPCTDAADNMTLSFQDAATADAGSDAGICETDSYILSGAATNHTAVLWTTSGTGTFDDDAILGAEYTPSAADITAGSVVLTLTATATAPCTDAADNMTLSFQDAATADAGSDATICSNDTYILSGAATNQTAVLWTTSGTGTFDDDAILGAEYTPSAADITAGSVVLTLTATATAPCTDAADNMTLSFQDAATADAGSDAGICETDTYILSGAATNHTAVLWTTSGTGTFDDDAILGAEYTPSAADITAGSVVLTLTATATAPCTDAADNMTLSFQDAATADAGSDATICSNDTYILSGAATNQTAVLWTTSGTGTFDDDAILGAEYTPSAADITAGSVVLTLTATATAPCTDAADNMTLSFQDAATADAGSDAGICETDTYILSGAATNHTAVLWTTSGTGTFDDDAILGAEYTPSAADITAGSVVLTLTATATAPCTDAADNMTLSFQDAATADAGSDATICSNDTYILSGAATNQTAVLWTTSGTGTFDDDAILGAEYTPSAADITAGSVVLTLTATATAPCTDAADNMTLSFQDAATADAGSDAGICETDTYILSGAATNHTAVLWTTSGTGTFDDDAILGAEYTPSAADITAGSVVLTLTATATAPCTDAADNMTLSFQDAATADAGSDATICSNDTYILSGAATNQTAVLWTTSGTGTFDDDAILGAEYTPSAADITAGSVVLTLTATATAPCTDAADNMTLSFQDAATADAGSDAGICETDTYILSGAATNHTAVLWTTSGTGTFDDDAILGAEYTPSAADITAGSVVLTLTATATAPCTDAADNMTLSIQLSATADAGTDANICETDTYLLSGAATNQTSVLWTSSGTGTFDDDGILAATYTPSGADITAGTVTLTLTAYSTAPCADASDDIVIGIYGQPTADAGTDGTACETGDYTLSGAATNDGSIQWTTAGDGTFDDDAILAATYTPGAGDITAGTVTLTLTAYAVAPCGTDATDDIIITIQDLPTANAGTDASVCDGLDYLLSGSATNQSSVLWTTAGDGTFDDDAILGATYTPGTNDIANGSVVLTLTASSTAPCATDVPDNMTLSIQGNSTADAGADATVASGSDYTLSGAATNQASVTWTTAGDGTFDDASLLAATYTPGTADLDFGSVVLTLTANATAPCSVDDADDMTLFFSFTQTTNLSLGWNIVSFYVQPTDLDMQNIFQPLIDNTTLIKVQDEDGNYVQFIPGPGWSNTIGNMANTEGYYVKVNANTSLDADGTYVLFPYDVALSTGWNMAGYPVKQSQDAMTILNDLMTNTTLVKVMDEAGNFIQNIPPYGWLNTIVNFDPGEGYYINVSADDQLTYAQPTKASSPGIVTEVPQTQHFFSFNGNPFSPMNIVVQNIIADGFQIEDGDEIAVYDGDIEVGSSVIHQGYGGLQVIIAAGDDPATEEIDGYTPGNTITFSYWDKSHNMVYENIQSTHYYGDKEFAGLGTYAGDLKISALGVSEYDQSAHGFLGQNYPNPFSNNTTINYGIYEDGTVLMSIFDVSGRRIHILEDANKTRGRYTVHFDNASLEPGVYYYQLELNSNGKVWSETRKMIVH